MGEAVAGEYTMLTHIAASVSMEHIHLYINGKLAQKTACVPPIRKSMIAVTGDSLLIVGDVNDGRPVNQGVPNMAAQHKVALV